MSVSMTMNGAVLPVMAFFIVAGEEQGVPLSALTGTIQNDILKEFAVRNTYIYPPEPSMRIVSDVIAYCAAEMPKFNSISISGYHMHEAGATAVQELAYTLADGMEYARAAMATGLEIDDFAGRLSFFWGIGMNLFMEVAKLRAGRTLWHRIMTQLGAQKDESKRLRTHCQTSGVSLTEQDPYNNIIRTTIEALAAVLGGTQSLHTNSFDEAIALPTDKSARLALRTQQVLAYETDVTATVDPFAGSYVIETMTDDVEGAAVQLMRRVEDLGGAVGAIEHGFQKGEIERNAYRIAQETDSGERVVVGVNRFRLDTEEPYEPLRVDPAIEAQQVERLARLRAERDRRAVESALGALRRAAEGTDNVLYPMKEALRARATVGEICDALREVWGTYVPADAF
jgi:methylmalonyl-CoA mutase N-terminal domain/subunit